MKLTVLTTICALSAGLASFPAVSQQAHAQSAYVANIPGPDAGSVILDWTPPALAQLSTEATSRSSFSLDRSMLGMAAGMMGDSDAQTKQAINKIDGVSVHMLRFGPAGVQDQPAISAIRDAYHLRGWKHVVTNATGGSPLHNGTTDVWVVMDGVNVRGAVVLAETQKSVTLVTVAGNLSPIDLMHLRGHFGIPNFDGDDMRGALRK